MNDRFVVVTDEVVDTLRNKSDLDTMSIDDLYNNFKIVEQEAEDDVPTNIALMAFSDSKEFQQPEFQSYGPKSCETKSKNASKEIPTKLKESPDALLVKDRVLDNKDYSVKSPVMKEKKTIVPNAAKIEFVRPKQQEKPVRKPVKYAETYMSQDTREVQIIATTNGKVKLVSEASIKRHLKLEDSNGISTLPNTEIFEQLALMGRRRRRAISTASSGISTAEEPVSTVGASMPVSTAVSLEKSNKNINCLRKLTSYQSMSVLYL
nr:hypothetical protein [Tanacetum cinerariifolium]